MKTLCAIVTTLAFLASPALAIDPVKPTSSTIVPAQLELKDGTKLAIESDSVFIIAKDGSKIPAPDGNHTLKDGTSIQVKNGKKLN